MQQTSNIIRVLACWVIATPLLAACAGTVEFPNYNAAAPGDRSVDRRASEPTNRSNDWFARLWNVASMFDYDTNADATVTQAELDDGIKEAFAEADINGDGVLDVIEVMRANRRLWGNQGALTSPIFDWNSDGIVNLAEFGGTQRSTFSLLDANRDTVVTTEELQPASQTAERAEPRYFR